MTELDNNMYLQQTGLSGQDNETGASDDRVFVTLKTGGGKLCYPEKAGSLLEALEYHGIAGEYQCRSGYCGSCRCRMTEGKVSYHQQALALINDGEILPCCCVPESDIELDI